MPGSVLLVIQQRASLTVFNGYGDGLLEYDKRRTWLRLGVSFSGYAD